MKYKVGYLILLTFLVIMGGCYANDAWTDTFYTNASLNPSANNSGSVGNASLYWGNGYFTNINGAPYPSDAYGQLYEDSAGSTITITSAGTYYQWVTTTAGDSYLTTLSAVSDNITISSDGDGEYRISYSVSYSASANDTVHWAVFFTASGGMATKLSNISSETLIHAQNEVVNSSSVGLKRLGVGDALDLRVTSTTNGTTIKVNHASLTTDKVAR